MINMMPPERSRTKYVFVGLTVALAVVLLGLSTVGLASTATETATIQDANPSECTSVDGGTTQNFELLVDYDLGADDPEHINIVVSEDGHGEITKTVDISDRASSDSVWVDVSEYVDPNWEKVTVATTVYPAGSSTSSARDEVQYPVSGSGWSCESNPEEIGGRVTDEDGDDPPPGIVVLERLSDGETQYVEYRTDSDCPGCFEFTDNEFVEPGDYRVHVYGDDGGYPPYWGYVDVSVLDGESEFVYVERGGVYSTGLRVTDGDGSTSDLRFGPRESVSTQIDLQNPRNGEAVAVEVYVYQSGGTRGDVPHAVFDPASLSDGPNTYDFTFEAPAEEGTYEVEYVVLTDFPEYDGLITDSVSGPTFDVEEYEPPQITDSAPDSPSPSVAANGDLAFSASASDPDTSDSDLRYEWYVDGQLEGTGQEFSLDGSEYESSSVSVEVSVSDGSDRTDPATASWSVDVVEAPSVTNVTPGGTRVTAGEVVDLGATATDPGGHTPLSYAWDIEGQRLTGPSASHRFETVGTREVTLTVENSRGVAAERSFSVEVENDVPSVDRATAGSTVDTVVTSSERFSVDVSDRDESTLTVAFVVDGRTVDSREIDRNQAGVSFDHAFTDPGSHVVEVVARDGHGDESSVSWSVQARSRPPTFTSRSPESSRVTDVMSGETVDFSAAATDPDDDRVSYDWYVDGEYAGSGSDFSRQFDESGQYAVRVVAEDEYGANASREWSVSVGSFREPLQSETQVTGTTLTSGSAVEFVTVSIQNPEVNDRTGRVEIVTSPPDDVEVSTTKNVREGDPAQFVGFDQIDPGESTSVTITLATRDESLVGESIRVPYRIVYYPEGNPDDATVIEEREISLDVRTTSTPTDDRASARTRGEDLPGFTGLAALLALASAIAFLVRRG